MTHILFISLILILLSEVTIGSVYSTCEDSTVNDFCTDTILHSRTQNTSISITIDTDTDSVILHMIRYTQSTVWAGFGFEYLPYNPLNYHNNTYAIILEYDINFQPIVTEYTLGYGSRGTQYPIPQLTIISDTTNGLWREVIATRPIDGTFSFPNLPELQPNNYQMVVTSAIHFNAARYATSLRHRANPHERNLTTVTFQLLSNEPAFQTTTSPTPSPVTQQPSNPPALPLCCACTTSIFNSGCVIDLQCQNKICIDRGDSLCCDSIWDEKCACQAHNICNVPTEQPTKAPTTTEPTCCVCTVPTITAGCPQDKICEDRICMVDRYCCDTEWDALCAPQAQDVCVLGTPVPTSMSNTLLPSIPNRICTPRPTTSVPTLAPTGSRTAKPTKKRMRYKNDDSDSSDSRSSSSSRDDSSDGRKNKWKKSKRRKGKKKRKKRKHYVSTNDEYQQEDELKFESDKQEGSGISIILYVCVFASIGLVMVGATIGLLCGCYKSRLRKEHIIVNDDEYSEDDIEDVIGTVEGIVEENESLKI